MLKPTNRQRWNIIEKPAWNLVPKASVRSWTISGRHAALYIFCCNWNTSSHTGTGILVGRWNRCLELNAVEWEGIVWIKWYLYAAWIGFCEHPHLVRCFPKWWRCSLMTRSLFLLPLLRTWWLVDNPRSGLIPNRNEKASYLGVWRMISFTSYSRLRLLFIAEVSPDNV